MNNNDEKDGYKNDTLVASYGYKFSDKLKIENNFRIADGYLQYDTLDDQSIASEDSDEQNHFELSGSAALVYEPNEKFTKRTIDFEWECPFFFGK